jgi:anthranilate/para-aminobenzoate synthase component I
VYAGGVGRWDFASDEMDVAIAIRTMTFKDGNVYFQAGGGIVFDSVEEDEYEETIRKLGANIKAIEEAESEFIYVDLALHVVGLIPSTLRIPLHPSEGG